jgi:hypothetical protein
MTGPATFAAEGRWCEGVGGDNEDGKEGARRLH